MTISTTPTHLTLSDTMYDIISMHFDTKHSEIFAIGNFGHIALTTLSGQLQSFYEISEDAEIIAQQRTPDGWQFIYLKDAVLVNGTLKDDDILETILELPCEKYKTAAWSPCGQFVAIGSEGTMLSVWDTHTGKKVMQKPIFWNKENDAEFINPPSLSVVAWSDNGEKIITIAEAIISKSTLVWDFKTQKVLSIIQ